MRGKQLMSGPEVIHYFTDLAMQLNGAILALFSLHATILVGAVGWAVTQRGQARGLETVFLPIVAIALMSFFAVNLYSLNELYIKLNAALSVLHNYWSEQHVNAEAAIIFEPVGLIGAQAKWIDYATSWQLIAAVLDFIVVVFVCIALSNLGRTSAR